MPADDLYAHDLSVFFSRPTLPSLSFLCIHLTTFLPINLHHQYQFPSLLFRTPSSPQPGACSSEPLASASMPPSWFRGRRQYPPLGTTRTWRVDKYLANQ